MTAGPPFAELHLHIEGTLEPETIFALAAQQGLQLPYRDVEDLAKRYDFTNLQSFLDLYYDNMAVLRTTEDFRTLTEAYLKRAWTAGVRHAELFVDPQAHTSRGVSVGAVLGGVSAALDAAATEPDGVTGGIIVCVLRDQPLDSAQRMLDEVLASGIDILGIGLDSAELGHPPGAFAPVFDRAAASGLRRVAHAGEEGPPAFVWEALDELGVERIDHGVRALEDVALLDRLVRDQVPLTVCPLSNVRLQVSPDVAAVPIRRMLDAGLLVTVNSDDPAYFGGYLDDNLDAVAAAHHLTELELARLARNSVNASFATEERKRALLRGDS
ncbi:MAG: adenosine deaminase [Leifsonia sp.]